jgi:hypothetical protein
MQAQLFISSALTLFSLAPVSLACGPDSPDQVSHPQFSVVTPQDHTVLKLSGPLAQTVFDHLKDPEVRRFNSDFYQIKIAFGIICVAQTALQDHTCWERFADDGEIQNYFPYTDQLKNSGSWLQLNLKGPSMEKLYGRMSEDGDIHEHMDGSIAYIKQRTAITCTRLVSPEGQSSFDCSQLLSAGGLPLGPGPDPMLGSGTHPVTVDVEEGVN